MRVRRADIPGAAVGARGRPRTAAAARTRGVELPLFAPREREMFYPDACEISQVGGELGTGAVAAWIRLRGDLVAGEPPSQLARVAAAADFANGLSWILPFRDWLFVNTELTIHLHREAVGEWIGLDARSSSSAGGFGLATATLHDLQGRSASARSRCSSSRADSRTHGSAPRGQVCVPRLTPTHLRAATAAI